MKRTIAALVGGLVLGTAGTAVAASQMHVIYDRNGITCGYSGTVVACAGSGYTIGMSPNVVMVKTRSGRTVFQRYQP